MTPALDPTRWRRAYVLGLGLSGAAAARLLRARGVAVVASDRRAAGELELGALAADAGVELRLGVDDATLPDGLDAVVTSPGVAPQHPLLAAARRAGVEIVGEIDLAASQLDGPLAAVTGSNGKSTTTAMAGALVSGAGMPVEVCGNIGRPLAEVALAAAPGRRFVVELSSFQLESMRYLRPRAAALLNLSPDHLDRHGDLDGYLAAKRRIFARQEAADVAVLNADDPAVAATVVAARRRLFSLRGPVADGCYLAGETVRERDGAGERALFRAADVPLPGPHNLENAMAAALLALALDVPAETVAASLRGFRGLPHRLERVAERDGVVFYDDSKGTNVGATARSLEGFRDGSVHLVLGGRNKGADFRALRDVVARKAKRVYLIGEAAPELARALAGATELSASGTLAAALEEAAARAASGEVVLLSPACASFDQFRDYADRGRTFQRHARELAGAPAAEGADG
jgi:UDP-N-acetylmuramoylalanine--D-glutamate ligase